MIRRMGLVLAIFATATLSVQAGENPVDQAISRGIAHLLTLQKEDGRIEEQGNATAMTALSIMSLAATGRQPTDPTREGAAMKKALEFVLREDRQTQDGYFGAADGSRMYGHGIITLMLAEMLGMGTDTREDQMIRQRLEKGVDLILRSQRAAKQPGHEGGWRYDPTSGDSDLSVTVWQVMALRAARNAGLRVPKEAIDGAVGYLRKCFYIPGASWDTPPSQRAAILAGLPADFKTACSYQTGTGPRLAMGAAGLLALQVCGEYDSVEVHRSADWLMRQDLESGHEYRYYGMYYMAQGLYQRGGDHAAYARKAIEGWLLRNQQGDGSWQGEGSESNPGKAYSTNMALLALAVKHHYLPIYQR